MRQARFAAYAAGKGGNATSAARAWQELCIGRAGYPRNVPWNTGRIVLKPIDEAGFVAKNATARCSLAATQCPAPVGDHLPLTLHGEDL